MKIKNYAEICKKFAAETAEWHRLPEGEFYTTLGKDWVETCDNAHGGFDVSWAFHETAAAIDAEAGDYLLQEVGNLVRLARDDEWEPEGLDLILDMLETLD